MPNYLAPGVYVAEIEPDAKPIEGVSTSTADLIGGDVTARLQRLAKHLRPDWTDHNQNDPGIALLELFAFLTEMLLYRPELVPERGVPHAARLAAAALALVTDRAQPHGSVLHGVHFFSSQLLNPCDPRLDTRRYVDRHNPGMHSGGIVCGLEIDVSTDGCGSAVNVTPGYVLDRQGRDIILKTPIPLPLPTALKCAFVIARWKFCAPLSIVLHPSVACEFLVVDEPKADDFPIGRLDKTVEGWRVARNDMNNPTAN
jgi:hypothetical protein